MTKSTARLTRIITTALLTLFLISAAAVFSDRMMSSQATEGAQSPFGPYLAGRFARANRDTAKAAVYYKRALDRDPSNERILEEAFFLEATAANWKRAKSLAHKLLKKDETHALANTFLGVHAFKNRRFKDAQKSWSVTMRGPIAELTAILSRAWSYQADGRINAALALLDKPGRAEWVNFYKNYHRALIADLSGRNDIALKAYKKIFDQDTRAVRIASMYARHAAITGKFDLAEEVIKAHSKKSGQNRPEILALLDTIKSNKKPKRLIRNSQDGLAEVYYGFGDALSAENGVDMATIYLQFALMLRPDFPVALNALASNYEAIAHSYEKSNKPKHLIAPKYQLAIDAYKKIPRNHPIWPRVQIRKAYNLNSLDRVDDAKTLLLHIAKLQPSNIRPLNALGDILRSHKRFKEASEYYGQAIALVKDPQKENWNLYYSRGVCYERIKQWPKAEADLKRALELNPDQPLVLNYLGYSWIDQNLHLEEALGLIRKAVKLKPKDGYFVDSLGWAYYRQGKFEAATVELEKAVELRPDDPVINDHLGDAYWKVGRRNEAKFQWSQALTLKPEPEEEEKIKKKLKDGLIDLDKVKNITVTTESAPTTPN